MPCNCAFRREDQEGMDDWDQEQLENVVNQKHGTEKPGNKTDIICKFFLDAVESKLYGWCAYTYSFNPCNIMASSIK